MYNNYNKLTLLLVDPLSRWKHLKENKGHKFLLHLHIYNTEEMSVTTSKQVFPHTEDYNSFGEEDILLPILGPGFSRSLGVMNSIT
jgi:hypothetical protein